MDNRDIKIRYCASVLSIPKKIIECGPLIVKNYKIKCDNNFEPFWYKIHVKDDVEKMRKIEKEILMNKYGMDDFVYNTSDEQYYKQHYDDEIYLFHNENMSNIILYNDDEIIDNLNQNYDYLNHNHEMNNINKYNIPLHVPIFKQNTKPINNTQKDYVICDDDKEKKKKIYNKIFKSGCYFEENESDNDSYDNWSSPNISDEEKIEEKTDEKTDNKKTEKQIDIDDYDDYIY